MRAVEMDFFPREETRGDEYGQFDGELESFISALQTHGNMLNGEAILELADCVQVRGVIAADDALSQTNWSIYTLESWEKLKQISVQEPQLRLIEEIDNDDAVCCCATFNSLVLFTTYIAISSPVDCLNCGLPVPLYRLPYLKEEKEHWTLREWEKQYQTFDRLYMNSCWGERMAYHQLSNPRSGFINHSRKVARELEEKVGKPVYVFLLHAYQQWSDTCPRCKRPWIWHDTPKSLFHFKCDHCRLISQEATSEAKSLSEFHP
ncbi:putative nucleic acid-binding protein, contains Zn-ribbon domain [Abditibacterium utsteinense]|uniref:Putative nucleic acid-binding protein, contains Zn-ribbon domain n=1 Tax=Abditibacterium utsteinense TaxID=1960156 RepID=A0A2S8SRQ5_9BACT|nr:DUF2310 family Zn-ribbon-containing protein [Abditibacterium utsteinense]PQV63465.1 putative nucleic acid-binding protein, contains Zn-ribbon domain [Abditibacterium utsteinense]